MLLDAPASARLETFVESELGVAVPHREGENSLAGWVIAARRRRKERNPDLIHAHLATPSFVSAVWAIAGSVPLVCTFHLLPASERWYSDYLLPIASNRVTAQLVRWKKALRLVAVSATDAARLQHHVNAPVVAVRNAPPFPPVAAALSPKPTLRTGGVRLLSVGRLDKQKGFDRMVAALATPTVRELDWTWTIVGDGSARKSLESQIAQAGLEHRVTLIGAAPAHTYFPESDLVLCPSRFEGMPLVPLEAVEAGVPVLASAILAHTELFGSAPSSILPEDELLWPQRLASLIADESVRAQIRAQQAGLLGDNPRERLWNDYRGIYESLL